MGTEAMEYEREEGLGHPWTAGAVGGLVGGVGMGLILHGGANVMPLIGALFGWPTVAGGWAVHLVNSLLIGLLFAAIVSRPTVHEQVDTVAGPPIAGFTVAGILYASAVGIVTAGVMLPVTMNLLGVRTLPEPILPLPYPFGVIVVVLSVGVAHVVYGLLLGATYGRLHAERSERAVPSTPDQ